MKDMVVRYPAIKLNGKYFLTTYKATTFTLQGIMQVMTPEGIRNFPFMCEYQVGESKVP